MHDKNDEFRLVGYRLVAETRDEERILNLGQWSIQQELFTQDSALHLILETKKMYPASSAGGAKGL